MQEMRNALCEVWPFFGLVIRTPRLELKLMLEHELAELASRVATDGIHDDGAMPFHDDWALQPSPLCQRRIMASKWLDRGRWLNGRLSLALGVYRLSDGVLMGCFDLHTEDPRLSTFRVDAWLLKPYQDCRYGQEAGQALLHLIFECIGADRSEAGHWHDNPRSGRAQLAAGATSNGDEWRMRRMPNGIEEAARMCATRITPETWQRPAFAVEVDGFEPCRELFCPEPETGRLPSPDELTAGIGVGVVSFDRVEPF